MRPSPEYINHIMVPEREEFRRRLKAGWAYPQGSWMFVKGHGIRLVTHVTDRGDFYLIKSHAMVFGSNQDGIVPVPGLGQLLRLIQAAGSGTIQMTDFGDRVVMHCGNHFGIADEPQIAGCKLLESLWGNTVEQAKEVQ